MKGWIAARKSSPQNGDGDEPVAALCERGALAAFAPAEFVQGIDASLAEAR